MSCLRLFWPELYWNTYVVNDSLGYVPEAEYLELAGKGSIEYMI